MSGHLELESRLADHEKRLRALEAAPTVASQLTTVYGYSNMQRAILTSLLAEAVKDEQDPTNALQQYYGTVLRHLRIARFPPNDPQSEEIRSEGQRLANEIFRDVQSLLLEWGTISEKNLIQWGVGAQDE